MLLWTWLAACTGGSDATSTPKSTGTDPSVTDSTGTTADTETTTTSSAPAATYYRDVQPLLAKSCARCHTGESFGPGSFLDYDVASSWAEVMTAEIDAGAMPPPAADPACHPYVDQEVYQADPALRDTLQAWIDAGKPAGDPPATAVEPWAPATLANPDLVLKTASPRVPTFSNDNEYRCFLLGKIDTDQYITGLEFLMDDPAITHHALLLVDTGGNSDRLVEDQASQSWGCSVTDMPGDLVHAWAPSGGALEFPAGTGMFVPAGSELILQMHYFQGTTDVQADQPGYAFTLADSVDKEMYYLPVGPLWFTIPAGDPAYTKTFTVPVWLVSSGSLDVWGAFPHMHVLGTAYDFHAEKNDGSETCISRADQYDFTLQPTYWFADPITVDASDTISVSCTWDNSPNNPLQFNDPPQDVHWGENTQDEMCYGFLYVTEH